MRIAAVLSHDDVTDLWTAAKVAVGMGEPLGEMYHAIRDTLRRRGVDVDKALPDDVTRVDPDTAPVGTIIVIGHPANGVTARHEGDGMWHYTDTLRVVSYDDVRKGASVVFVPPRRT